MDLFSVSKGEIKGVRTLTKSEFNTYDSQVRRLRQFERAANVITFVQQTHFEVEKEIGAIQAEVIVLGAGSRDSFNLSMRVNLRLINLLSAFRLYLDHTEFRLARWYGKKSRELQTLRRLTSDAYDTHFAYRFLYKLRNFAQHCGLPVGHVAVDSRLKNPPALQSEHRLKVLFRTADLLREDRAVWGKVAKELEQKPEDLDVLPLVRKVGEIVPGIHSEVIEVELPHIKKAAGEVHDIVKDAFDHGGSPVVGEIVDFPGGGNFKAMPPPARLMNELGYSQYRKVV